MSYNYLFKIIVAGEQNSEKQVWLEEFQMIISVIIQIQQPE